MMKAAKHAVHNTALLETRRRWPRKADYLEVPREKAVSLIEDFGTVFGFECLRERGNFRSLSYLVPRHFDVVDLHQALEYIIDTVNAKSDECDSAAALKDRLEQHFGPLTGFIAVRLSGWPFVIEPKAAVQ